MKKKDHEECLLLLVASSIHFWQNYILFLIDLHLLPQNHNQQTGFDDHESGCWHPYQIQQKYQRVILMMIGWIMKSFLYITVIRLMLRTWSLLCFLVVFMWYDPTCQKNLTVDRFIIGGSFDSNKHTDLLKMSGGVSWPCWALGTVVRSITQRVAFF